MAASKKTIRIITEVLIDELGKDYTKKLIQRLQKEVFSGSKSDKDTLKFMMLELEK